MFAVATGWPALRMIFAARDYDAMGLRAVARGHAAFIDGPDGDLCALFPDAALAVRLGSFAPTGPLSGGHWRLHRLGRQRAG